MRTHPGFARLLPLAGLIGAVGFTVLVPMWLSAREAARPCSGGNIHQLSLALQVYWEDCDGGSDAPVPVAPGGIVDADGRGDRRGLSADQIGTGFDPKMHGARQGK